MMNIEMSIKQSDEAGMNGTSSLYLCCKEMKELSGNQQHNQQHNDHSGKNDNNEQWRWASSRVMKHKRMQKKANWLTVSMLQGVERD